MSQEWVHSQESGNEIKAEIISGLMKSLTKHSLMTC